MNKTQLKTRVCIFGVGYVGQPLFFECKKRYEVYGVRLSKPDIENQFSIEEKTYSEILSEIKPDVCIISWAPSARSEEEYKKTYLDSMRTLCEAFKVHKPKQVVYTSSTGVYAAVPSREVVETDMYLATDSRQSLLVEAEKQLQRTCEEIGSLCSILRLTGIYGPDRVPCLRLLRSEKTLPGNANSWSHLIHRDDIIQAILICIEKELQGVFNLSDGNLYHKKELYDFVALHYKTKAPIWDLETSMIEGKQISSSKFYDESGFKPKFNHFYDWLK